MMSHRLSLINIKSLVHTVSTAKNACPLEVVVTCTTNIKFTPQHNKKSLLPRTLSPFIHTRAHTQFFSSVHHSTFCRLFLSHNTMVNCLHACLFQWTVSCFIHLCVPSTYQDQAHGWHALNVQ